MAGVNIPEFVARISQGYPSELSGISVCRLNRAGFTGDQLEMESAAIEG